MFTEARVGVGCSGRNEGAGGRDSGRTSTRRTSKGHIRGNQKKKEVEIIENKRKTF